MPYLSRVCADRLFGSSPSEGSVSASVLTRMSRFSCHGSMGCVRMVGIKNVAKFFNEWRPFCDCEKEG